MTGTPELNRHVTLGTWPPSIIFNVHHTVCMIQLVLCSEQFGDGMAHDVTGPSHDAGRICLVKIIIIAVI